MVEKEFGKLSDWLPERVWVQKKVEIPVCTHILLRSYFFMFYVMEFKKNVRKIN